MTLFVLIPGSHHGGWWYDPLVERLTDAGHQAVAVTLPGLDPEAEPTSRAITLDDHVAAALTIMDASLPPGDGRDAVLVGHSYGGSIITALADARPERIRTLVYLDALLPENGDSSWSMTNDDEHEWYVQGSAASGAFVDPLPFFDERARPHPLPTLMQASKLIGAWRQVPVKHFVIATEWPGESPMAAMSERALNDPSIEVHEWATTHNVLKDGPDRVFDLIADL